jgi:hypothetical protein
MSSKVLSVGTLEVTTRNQFMGRGLSSGRNRFHLLGVNTVAKYGVTRGVKKGVKKGREVGA